MAEQPPIAELKVIESQLTTINESLNKLLNRFDTLQAQVNASNLKINEFETWKTVSQADKKLDEVGSHANQLNLINQKLMDYDKIKNDIVVLQDAKSKFTVIMSVAMFVVSTCVSLLSKLLLH